ncbi:ribonuclease H-like domain-containing protein [Tanacetum coccineum]
MSEAEPIPPTSSVTALRIPMIKKGEYDLWSMKMRQYIAITDHILWDIITNGDQATTDPASSSAPKTSLAANARRNNEKALNILLSAIPDRHLLSFHDAEDAKTLWSAIKARFGGNEASKKMQKNLLKQQFETFTIGSREELDSAYERFQNILSMLELYDAKVSHEDANLKFLRSLPSVWHVVATMIRGQPGLDELEFDDLYNNLKVYEHELKGVSNSSSQNIAFLSTEIKGSTLKQSTADSENIPKGYTQAASSKVQTAPNCASHSDEIICSFFAQQASMPTTHDDEDLLQIDEDAMEEIDIRWQVAMITARIRKFMRKTGRPIDLKPKNGITFDKSKIECFNCQKLGHFARECRFAKYQENRANGRKEKKIVAIEDSNSKALVATDNNEEIDWTKEFDAEPVTFAMMALTELEEDDWSMEIDAEPVHFGQDGLGDFDWSNKADDTPVSLALMATNSEESSSSKESDNSSGNTNSTESLYPNFQKAKGFHAVPPPTDWVDRDDEETQLKLLEIQKSNCFELEKIGNFFETQFSPSNKVLQPQGTPHKDHKDQENYESIGIRIESTVGSHALPSTKCEVSKESAMINPNTNMETKRAYLDYVNVIMYLTHSSKLSMAIPEERSQRLSKIDSGSLKYDRRQRTSCLIFKRIQRVLCGFGNEPKGLPSNTFKLDHVMSALERGNKKSSRQSSCNFLEDQENTKRKRGSIGCLILNFKLFNELHTSKKENYADSGGKLEEKLIRGTYADKEVPLNAFEEEKRRIALEKGKESANSTLTLSTANTPSQRKKEHLNTTTKITTIDVPALLQHLEFIESSSEFRYAKSTAGGKVLTRRKLKESASYQHQALLSFMCTQNRTNHKDQQTCLFACFLSQKEPKKVSQALADESWVEAMQEELLQFKLQNVWVLCDLPDGKRVIGTKWVFRNKRDERGTIIKNKARLGCHKGTVQRKWWIKRKFFAPIARIEAIRLFLHCNFHGFYVYRSSGQKFILYGNNTEEEHESLTTSWTCWDKHERRSTQEDVNILGGRPGHWQCKKQTELWLSSSTEAEK